MPPCYQVSNLHMHTRLLYTDANTRPRMRRQMMRVTLCVECTHCEPRAPVIKVQKYKQGQRTLPSSEQLASVGWPCVLHPPWTRRARGGLGGLQAPNQLAGRRDACAVRQSAIDLSMHTSYLSMKTSPPSKRLCISRAAKRSLLGYGGNKSSLKHVLA